MKIWEIAQNYPTGTKFIDINSINDTKYYFRLQGDLVFSHNGIEHKCYMSKGFLDSDFKIVEEIKYRKIDLTDAITYHDIGTPIYFKQSNGELLKVTDLNDVDNVNISLSQAYAGEWLIER